MNCIEVCDFDDAMHAVVIAAPVYLDDNQVSLQQQLIKHIGFPGYLIEAHR